MDANLYIVLAKEILEFVDRRLAALTLDEPFVVEKLAYLGAVKRDLTITLEYLGQGEEEA